MENYRLVCQDTLWVENFDKTVLSHTVKEIEANLCFSIFGKNAKIQNGRHFWGEENLMKIANSTLLRYIDAKTNKRPFQGCLITIRLAALAIYLMCKFDEASCNISRFRASL